MKYGKRRLAEMQDQSIQMLVGLTFENMELQKIAKKLGIPENRGHGELCSMLVKASRYPAESKKLEKIFERKFRTFETKINLTNPEKILRAWNDGFVGFENIPIAAMLWHLLRSNEIDEMEILSSLSMLRFKALRLYDSLRMISGKVKPREIIEFFMERKNEKEKLIKKCATLKNKLRKAKKEIKFLEDRIKNCVGELEREKKKNNEYLRILQRVNPERFEMLRKENEILKRELQEVLQATKTKKEQNHSEKRKKIKDKESVRRIENKETEAKDANMRILYIGGIDSLVPNYQKIAEEYGCKLLRLKGDEKGESIRKAIQGVDVVFCPVDINSHNACRYAKKICKRLEKPCIFLQSSGISTLKRGLIRVGRTKNRNRGIFSFPN